MLCDGVVWVTQMRQRGASWGACRHNNGQCGDRKRVLVWQGKQQPCQVRHWCHKGAGAMRQNLFATSWSQGDRVKSVATLPLLVG